MASRSRTKKIWRPKETPKEPPPPKVDDYFLGYPEYDPEIHVYSLPSEVGEMKPGKRKEKKEQLQDLVKLVDRYQPYVTKYYLEGKLDHIPLGQVEELYKAAIAIDDFPFFRYVFERTCGFKWGHILPMSDWYTGKTILKYLLTWNFVVPREAPGANNYSKIQLTSDDPLQRKRLDLRAIGDPNLVWWGHIHRGTVPPNIVDIRHVMGEDEIDPETGKLIGEVREWPESWYIGAEKLLSKFQDRYIDRDFDSLNTLIINSFVDLEKYSAWAFFMSDPFSEFFSFIWNISDEVDFSAKWIQEVNQCQKTVETIPMKYGKTYIQSRKMLDSYLDNACKSEFISGLYQKVVLLKILYKTFASAVSVISASVPAVWGISDILFPDPKPSWGAVDWETIHMTKNQILDIIWNLIENEARELSVDLPSKLRSSIKKDYSVRLFLDPYRKISTSDLFGIVSTWISDEYRARYLKKLVNTADKAVKFIEIYPALWDVEMFHRIINDKSITKEQYEIFEAPLREQGEKAYREVLRESGIHRYDTDLVLDMPPEVYCRFIKIGYVKNPQEDIIVEYEIDEDEYIDLISIEGAFILARAFPDIYPTERIINALIYEGEYSPLCIWYHRYREAPEKFPRYSGLTYPEYLIKEKINVSEFEKFTNPTRALVEMDRMEEEIREYRRTRPWLKAYIRNKK